MTYEELMTPEQKERLKLFKAEIPQQLEKLYQLAAESENYKQVKPGYTYETLQLVENYYFDLMNHIESSIYSQAQLNELFGVYLGEAALYHQKEKWIVDPFKDNYDFNQIVIAFPEEELLLFNPKNYLNNMIYHNKRNCIVESIDYMKNYKQFNKKIREEMENLGKSKKRKK